MVEQLQFIISGEFVTQHARCLWTENPPAALEFLEAAGLEDESLQILVLTGKKAVEGENEFTLIDDNSTHTRDNIKLPSVLEIIKRLTQEAEMKQFLLEGATQYLQGEIVTVAGPFGKMKVPRSWTDQVSRIAGNVYSLKLLEGETPDEARRRLLYFFPDSIPNRIDFSEYPLEMVRERVLTGLPPTPETELPEEEALFQLNDKEFRYLDGFVLPDGTFHGCDYMKHWAILQELGLSEEPEDWTKIQDAHRRRSQGLPTEWGYINWPRHITQRQIDTIFDWSEAHGIKVEFPEER